MWKPDYVTVEEQADYERIGDLDDTATLQLAVTAASRAVDRCTHRQFGFLNLAQERRYTARWNRRRCLWVVSVDDFMDTSGLTVTIAGATVTYTAEPINAVDEGRPYERLVVDKASVGKPTGLDGEVVATVKWGWTAVPDPVKQATHLQASRFHTRRQAPFGIAGSPDQGSEMRLLSKVDPDVAVSLKDFVRDRVKAGS